MKSLTKQTLKKDIRMKDPCHKIWNYRSSKPEIRQIYGHFLPPYHMKIVKGTGLVAKDFNFPSAHHSVAELSQLCILYGQGEKIKKDTVVSINDSIKIREEKNGAIIYTPYFNGFFLNKAAWKILNYCREKITIGKITLNLGYTIDIVSDFIARALTLGIIDVYPERT